MKIGITLHPYGETAPAGLAETICSLSKTLVEQDTEHTFIFFVKGDSHIKPVWLDSSAKHEFRCVPKSIFWLDTAAQMGKDIDVWVYNTPMLPLFSVPDKTVVIALDFAYLHLPESGIRNAFKTKLIKCLHGRALKKATHIVSISRFTSDDVLRWFPSVSKNKITTIMAGFRDLTQITPDSSILTFEEDFYLCLGVIKKRKNQLNTVKGFLKAKEEGLKGKLLVAGKGSPQYVDEIKQIVKTSSLQDSVIFSGYLSDHQVVAAYQKTTALVFPSRLEGFGFPVLEAMSLGVPVVTSNTNSVGEIAGDAAITVDPESVDEIAKAYLKMQDKAVRDYYIAKGFDRIKEFSWKKTAERLVRVIESI
jgi:glycosyltransferase involved in cell wall biosynthesis